MDQMNDRRTRMGSALSVLTAVAAFTGLAVLVTALAPLAVAGESAPGQVYVIQGLSGRNLDIVVDGKVVLAAAARRRSSARSP